MTPTHTATRTAACALALLACGTHSEAAPATSAAIRIAAAELAMGCEPTRDPQCAPTEQPMHRVPVAAFAIDREEVSNGGYAECVSSGACTPPSNGLAPSEWARRPVAHVTWNQARAFCRWRHARLPSEAEWELAARGTDGRVYPWGDEPPSCDRAWTSECGDEPAEVGGRPRGASPYGVRDMAGNVDEWVEDAYASYSGGVASAEHVARGGAYDAWHSRSTARNALSPEYHDALLGFRCASD